MTIPAAALLRLLHDHISNLDGLVGTQLDAEVASHARRCVADLQWYGGVANFGHLLFLFAAEDDGMPLIVNGKFRSKKMTQA